jgi:hypothetical protein
MRVGAEVLRPGGDIAEFVPDWCCARAGFSRADQIGRRATAAKEATCADPMIGTEGWQRVEGGCPGPGLIMTVRGAACVPTACVPAAGPDLVPAARLPPCKGGGDCTWEDLPVCWEAGCWEAGCRPKAWPVGDVARSNTISPTNLGSRANLGQGNLPRPENWSEKWHESWPENWHESSGAALFGIRSVGRRREGAGEWRSKFPLTMMGGEWCKDLQGN